MDLDGRAGRDSDDKPLSPAILEAMALRVPVMATDAGGSNEMIQDERTGLLIEHDNAARLLHFIHQRS